MSDPAGNPKQAPTMHTTLTRTLRPAEQRHVQAAQIIAQLSPTMQADKCFVGGVLR